MDGNDYLLSLTREALSDLERDESHVATAMRRAIRIARMRGDWEAVYWLSMELEPLGDMEARHRRIAEVAPQFTREEMKLVHAKAIKASLASRALGYVDKDGRIHSDKVTSLSVSEIEAVARTRSTLRHEPLPTNLHPYDAAELSEQRRKASEQLSFDLGELLKILSRLGQRTHAYLSRVEQQLFLGHQQADFVEHNRRFVDTRLAEVCPDALQQLRTAHTRANEDTPEARSHALTSARRALKSLADRLYPPRSAPVRGSDGKDRVLDDSKYVNRLWQFIAESSARSAARQLLQGEIDQLGATVERLNDLSSKGVHGEVNSFEVNACLAALYNLAGALIRLHDEVSGASLDPDTLLTR